MEKHITLAELYSTISQSPPPPHCECVYEQQKPDNPSRLVSVCMNNKNPTTRPDSTLTRVLLKPQYVLSSLTQQYSPKLVC